MEEVIITARNFDAKMKKYSHKKIAEVLCKELKREIGEKLKAVVYINGCNYYVRPIDNSRMGFGSGKIEVIFEQDDNETAIKSKFLRFFDRNYPEIVGYSGVERGAKAAELIDKFCDWDRDLSYTKIFYIMGKSGSGKDTIKRELKSFFPKMKSLVTYTTRPRRKGEREGVDYHFINDETLEKMKSEKKILEFREYNTVQGMWTYATAKVEKDGIYIGIGTLESYEKLKKYYCSQIVPIYIELDDNIRLERAFEREKLQENPNFKELCRRAVADENDFSEEKLEAAGIKKRFYNDVLQQCVDQICCHILLRMPEKRRRKRSKN